MNTRFIALFAASLFCVSCQPENNGTTQASAPANATGNFFEQLGNAVKEGVKNGIDNGIQTTDSVGVLGYTLMPSKLTGRNEPAYCLENPVTHQLITVSPMFGRPYPRPDGTIGFMETTKQVSQHTQKVEVNLNGVIPGNTCSDLISAHRLAPGIAPDYYY